MRDEVGNFVGIFIAHRIDVTGRIAEFVVYDEDAPWEAIEAVVAALATTRTWAGTPATGEPATAERCVSCPGWHH